MTAMGAPDALLLVHGDEHHLVDATVDAWRAAAGDDVEVVDASTRTDQLIASLVDVPLFAAERHVLVRDLPQLTGARRGATGGDAVAHAVTVRSATTRVCFAVHGTVAAGNVILAAVGTAGGRVVHHARLRSFERKQWLEREVRRRELRLPAGAIDLLLRATGGELGALVSELDKVAAFGAPPTAAQLEQLVAGTDHLDLYRVVDLLGSARPAEGAALLAGLVAEGRSTQHLLSILAGQLRDLLLVDALALRGQRGPAAIATGLRVPSWRAERLARTAAAIPAPLAAAWIGDLQRIDAGLKAGEVDDAAALTWWGLRAARSLQPRPNATA